MKILPKLRSTGIKNFSKLLSANIIAQIIGLIVYPILTRIYTPEDFGLLNLFLSISGVLVILSTAEYYNAIVHGVTKKDFPPVPVDYGYRDSTNFWYTPFPRFKKPIAEPIPAAKEVDITSVRYASGELNVNDFNNDQQQQ